MIVANSPFDIGLASKGGAGGVGALAMTAGVLGAEGVRAVFGLGFDSALFRAAGFYAFAAAVLAAAAFRAGEDGFARPDRPRR